MNRTPTYRQRLGYAWSVLAVTCTNWLIYGTLAMAILLRMLPGQPPMPDYPFGGIVLLVFFGGLMFGSIWGGFLWLGRMLTGRSRKVKVIAALTSPVVFLAAGLASVLVGPFYYLYNLYRLLRDGRGHRAGRRTLREELSQEDWQQLRGLERRRTLFAVGGTLVACGFLLCCMNFRMSINGQQYYLHGTFPEAAGLVVGGGIAGLLLWKRSQRETDMVAYIYEQFEDIGDPVWLRRMAKAAFPLGAGSRHGQRMAMRAHFFCGDYSSAAAPAWETARNDPRPAQRQWGCNILLTSAIIQEAPHDYRRARDFYTALAPKLSRYDRDVQLLAQDLDGLLRYGDAFFAGRWEEARAVFDQPYLWQADGRSRLALLRCYLVLLADSRCAQPGDYTALAKKIEAFGGRLMIADMMRKLMV